MRVRAVPLTRHRQRPGAQQALSVAERCFRARDRLLQSPNFQRFSATFPLTRPIASRQAQALFDLCAGFVYSQVLSACVEFDLFRRLADGPRSAADLARELELPANNLERVLLAACSLKLVARRRGGRFGLGMLGAALNGNPGIAAMVRHHAVLYRDLADPVALLRGQAGTGLSQYWAYAAVDDPAALGEAQVGRYSELMTASQPLIADDVLGAYPFERHRIMLDVGGGEGAFIASAARRHPGLQFMLCDLPAVAARARARLGAQGVAARVVISGLDFMSDPLPKGADLITFVRVIHDHDDDAVRRLLAAACSALEPGGSIVIAEPMAGVARSEAVGDAYFGMYLLAMGQGRPRPAAEIGRLLGEAGFVNIRVRKTPRPMLVGVVSATYTRTV